MNQLNRKELKMVFTKMDIIKEVLIVNWRKAQKLGYFRVTFVRIDYRSLTSEYEMLD